MTTAQLVTRLQDAGQDHEWYPTTRRMLEPILRRLDKHTDSILDVGAGDGRVLRMFAERCEHAKLFAIEKAALLLQQLPESVIPVGTEFIEQDLMALRCSVVFSNPPYSEYELWAARIITTAHADDIYLILPQRWETSEAIAAALKARGAKAEIIHRDDFEDGDRPARAIVHVLRVRLARDRWGHNPEDPFDRWFDQNIGTFDKGRGRQRVRAGAARPRAAARLRQHRGAGRCVQRRVRTDAGKLHGDLPPRLSVVQRSWASTRTPCARA